MVPVEEAEASEPPGDVHSRKEACAPAQIALVVAVRHQVGNGVQGALVG